MAAENTSPQGGFTLIEVLVALLVLTVDSTGAKTGTW